MCEKVLRLFLSGVIRSTKMPEASRGSSLEKAMKSEDVLLLESLDDAVTIPYEREFRLVTDGPHIIRLRQDPTSHFETGDSSSHLSPYSTSYLMPRAAENIVLEGLMQTAEAARIEAFIAGQARRLSLEYQDEQTIAVMGEWQGADGASQHVALGFLPDTVIVRLRDIAEEAVPLGVAATIRTLCLPGPGRDAEIWCDVWTLEA